MTISNLVISLQYNTIFLPGQEEHTNKEKSSRSCKT